MTDSTDDARWRAYQAWLRTHGDGFIEPADPDDAASPHPSIAMALRRPPPATPVPPPSAPTAASAKGRPVGAIAAGLALLALTAALSLTALRHGRGAGERIAPPGLLRSSEGLRVEADPEPDSRLRPPQTLPCFVGGRPVADMTVAACARSNGVDSGRLDVGLGEATPPGHVRPPAAAPAPPSLSSSSLAAQTSATASPSAVPAIPPFETPPDSVGRQAAVVPDPADTLRTVRRFYRALAAGDEDEAAAWLAPERRGEGAAAVAGLGRFDGDGPLRVTEIDPLGPASVLVRYKVPDRDGDVCVAAAHVDTVVRGEETLVRSIHTVGGC